MDNKKVDTNDMLQMRRLYKALNLNQCAMYLGNSVSVDYHIFLCCLWHRDLGKDCLDFPRVIGYLLKA